MKTLIAYTNENTIENFLEKNDEIVSVEKGNFEHWGKKWKIKTTFKSSKKTNRICADYNLGVTENNTFIKD
ncbi:hypothetical protein CP985_13630 [Malaciobacter mytili LMG 24559]|uniref:Uncharacterized protein n=1 Tax=Malaciobacter mytili LMG 24559 TaxID=1032238 RepID=A0AAX2ABS2_9BACT|nr:hypothetical protein [Malaciobacter mytili]AXH16446.1 hypothetical protein AMYT_a0148 [Malaciobacter mytili LMG 24559]RXK12991.1 hypothetical protein CP985_13630 [Malaciobacter mytili LMG 24559]